MLVELVGVELISDHLDFDLPAKSSRLLYNDRKFLDYALRPKLEFVDCVALSNVFPIVRAEAAPEGDRLFASGCDLAVEASLLHLGSDYCCRALSKK